MQKRILLLAGFLALQLVIALSIFLLGNSRSGDFAPEPLLSFDESKLDKVVISEPNNDVILLKSDRGWQLSKNGLPVAQAKLNRLLEKLASLKTEWPVTTTSSSHERFEVASDNYRRKVSFFQGDKPVAELYVGTSPGFKKSHLRVDDQDEVYGLEFNDYDASATSKDWLDKSLLAVKTVMRIKGEGFTLTKEDDLWRIEPVQDTRELDQKKAGDLAKAIGAFKIMEVAAKAPEFEKDKVVDLDVDNGETYSFELMKEDERYFVKRTGIDHVFTLSKYEYERLSKSNIEFLTFEKTVKNADVELSDKESSAEGSEQNSKDAIQ